jgi:hypothetical protein
MHKAAGWDDRDIGSGILMRWPCPMIKKEFFMECGQENHLYTSQIPNNN